MLDLIENKAKKILLKNLNIKYINQLRRLKWFILNPFINDLKEIEKFYNDELEIKVLEDLIPYSAAKCPLPPVVIDVGANIGAYSYYLSEFIEEFQGQCIGFEPRKNIWNRLKQNVKKKNFTAERLALSNKIGIANLYLPANHENSSLIWFNHFAGFKTEKVNLSTLDKYISSKNISSQSIVFIKIDVEGHEFEILKGGRLSIAGAKPIILCELENRHLLPQGKTVQLIIDFLGDIGYRGYVISKRSFQLSSIEQISIPLNKSTPGEYFYNFWFLSEDSYGAVEKIENVLEKIRMENASNILN